MRTPGPWMVNNDDTGIERSTPMRPHTRQFGCAELATTKKVPQQIKEAIRSKYAWPGGYPLFLVTSDGAALCCDCGKKEYRQIVYSIRHCLNDGWRVEDADINWEDPSLFCDHCGTRIESAYAEE